MNLVIVPYETSTVRNLYVLEKECCPEPTDGFRCSAKMGRQLNKNQRLHHAGYDVVRCANRRRSGVRLAVERKKTSGFANNKGFANKKMTRASMHFAFAASNDHR